MSEVQVTHMKTEESGEARRLRKSLEEMADESKSPSMLRECGLPENALLASSEQLSDDRWSWSEVKKLSDSLLLALDASLEHALLASVMTVDIYGRLFYGMPSSVKREGGKYLLAHASRSRNRGISEAAA